MVGASLAKTAEDSEIFNLQYLIFNQPSTITAQPYHLFTDGSVHTQSKIGYGAYLYTNTLSTNFDLFKKQIRLQKFKNTSSSKLEIENLLSALKKLPENCESLNIYTDSQNIIRLPERRKKLEEQNYISKNNKQLDLHESYKSFYQFTDTHNCKIIQVKGHKQSKKKDQIDQIFSLVDQAARKAVRSSLV